MTSALIPTEPTPSVTHVASRGRAPSRAELAAVALAIAALLALPFVVPSLRVLLLRPLWLDELHTWLLARELPGPALVDRLARGADFNPPLLYLIDAAMLRLLPAVPPQMTLRITSVLAVGGAALLLYVASRNRVGAVAAAVASLGFLSHPVLLGQLHEARFYAVWLLLAVGVAVAMQQLVERPDSASRFARLALLSALTCLIHYFGVISLGCLAAGALLQRTSREKATRLLAAMGVGVLALVAWLPVYARQRHVLSVPTWVEPVTLDQFTFFVKAYYAWLPVAFVLVAVAVQGMLRGRRSPDEGVSLSTAQAALLGLMALPPVLVGFSLVVQPALVDRYALPAVAGIACVVAIAIARLPFRVQQLLLVGAFLLHARALRERAGSAATFAAGVRGRVRAVNAVANDPRPVVASERNTLYPVALSAANRNPRLSYISIPNDSMRRYFSAPGERPTADRFIVEHDAAIAHREIFGFPRLLALDSLRRLESYFVLGYQPDRPQLAFLYEGRALCRVRPYLFLVSNATASRTAPNAPVPDCPASGLAASPRN